MASLGSFVRNSTTETSTPGTLQSTGLYHRPDVPNQSQARGIRGTDGRAYTREVQDNELVRNQLFSLLDDPNSAYIKQARQQGLAQAASRGLGNSSIAAGAAQREAIKAGLPIASQDASTFSSAQTENMGALNQNLMQEREIANQMLLQQKRDEAEALAGTIAAQNARQEQELRLQLQRENLAYEGEQRGLDRGFENYMQGMGYQYDLGRARQGYGFDLGRMGYQFDLEDRNAGRRFQETIYRDNNQFGNQLYSDMYNTILQSRVGRSDAAYAMFLQNLYDGELDPNTLAGALEFSRMLAEDDIYGDLFGG